jgi:hypothetical protein
MIRDEMEKEYGWLEIAATLSLERSLDTYGVKACLHAPAPPILLLHFVVISTDFLSPKLKNKKCVTGAFALIP